MMKICLLSDTYPPDPGGLAVSARRLAGGLAAAGHSVHVCAPDSELLPGQVRTAGVEGVTVHRFGPYRRPDDTRSDWFELVASLHAGHAFDVLHAYYLVGAAFVAVYAGRYLGVPAVISARGNDLDRTVFDPAKAGSILWALANADAVTAVSTDLARKAAALAAGRPVKVIANGVDSSLFVPAPRDEAVAARFGLGSGPLVGFVGEARLKKGLGVLLPAFARVTANCPSAPPPRLVLVGGVRQDDAGVLRVFQAQAPGVPVTVISYTGAVDMPLLYNLLDVLALPSLRDGLPNALLEGMACARAIVATPVGGIPEAVRPGYNGLLVPPGDVEALAGAITSLLRQPEERARLGQAARDTAVHHFSTSAELAANLALYERLVGAPLT